jgi:hypothetical protein
MIRIERWIFCEGTGKSIKANREHVYNRIMVGI